MQLFYRIAADVAVAVHMAFVLFVTFGLLLILIGIVRKWQWVCNLYFRLVHLVAIGFVVAETWCGITCPLTIWEKQFRKLAGQTTYRGDFLANLVHELLFFEAPNWVFAVCYTLFGLAVLATFIWAPPRWRFRSSRSKQDRR